MRSHLLLDGDVGGLEAEGLEDPVQEEGGMAVRAGESDGLGRRGGLGGKLGATTFFTKLFFAEIYIHHKENCPSALTEPIRH